MRQSTDVVRAITASAKGIPVIALGTVEAEKAVIEWAEIGVAGFVFQRDSVSDLMALVKSVLRGETLCPPRFTAALLRHVANLASDRTQLSPIDCLTFREREILVLAGEGLSNKEIAGQLSIEVRTVKNHLHNIFEKLDVHRREEAAAVLRRAGIGASTGD